jgi:hypothetical protein
MPIAFATPLRCPGSIANSVRKLKVSAQTTVRPSRGRIPFAAAAARSWCSCGQLTGGGSAAVLPPGDVESLSLCRIAARINLAYAVGTDQIREATEYLGDGHRVWHLSGRIVAILPKWPTLPRYGRSRKRRMGLANMDRRGRKSKFKCGLPVGHAQTAGTSNQLHPYSSEASGD